MLLLLCDMGVIWTLFNIFSDKNWDEEILTLLGIVLLITLLGGAAIYFGLNFGSNFDSIWVGILGGLGGYWLIGVGCMKYLAGLSFKNAAIAMSLFTVYRTIIGLVLRAIFSPL